MQGGDVKARPVFVSSLLCSRDHTLTHMEGDGRTDDDLQPFNRPVATIFTSSPSLYLGSEWCQCQSLPASLCDVKPVPGYVQPLEETAEIDLGNPQHLIIH